MKHTKEKIQALLDELGSVKEVAERLGYSAARYLTIYIQRQGWKIEKTFTVIDRKKKQNFKLVDREDYE